MMKKNLLLILMCFVCGLVYAHDGLNFRNLDVKSGISDNYVRSVLRDQYGFMWFATLNGLNRYDLSVQEIHNDPIRGLQQ